MKTFLTFVDESLSLGTMTDNAYGGYSFGVMKPMVDLNAKFSQKDVDDIEKFADRILKKYEDSKEVKLKILKILLITELRYRLS